MRCLSLYSGIGGIDLAASWAGIKTVAFCECDAFCRSILARHWPNVPIFESDEHVTAQRLRDVAADRMDATRWPAARGCKQFDCEPPRVTNIREFRRKRLKALGNAVVPLQIYPILALIAELWRIEQERAA